MTIVGSFARVPTQGSRDRSWLRAPCSAERLHSQLPPHQAEQYAIAVRDALQSINTRFQTYELKSDVTLGFDPPPKRRSAAAAPKSSSSQRLPTATEAAEIEAQGVKRRRIAVANSASKAPSSNAADLSKASALSASKTPTATAASIRTTRTRGENSVSLHHPPPHL